MRSPARSQVVAELEVVRSRAAEAQGEKEVLLEERSLLAHSLQVRQAHAVA